MKNQICRRCVMDASDPLISFNDDGVCNFCEYFFSVTQNHWYPGPAGEAKLTSMVAHLKKCGQGNEFDAILGLSGGVDSSYLALKSKEWGLRLLVVHVDGGWNSEVAVSNIEKLVDYCGYELFTRVIDWNEMQDLQLAYMKSGVPNQDVPQDHAFFSALYQFATQNKLRNILSGGNIATEGISPDWMFDALDARNLNAIQKKHGKLRLRDFPRVSFFQRFIWYPFFHRMRVLRPLNFMHYSKDEAMNELKSTVGWNDYGRKHGESHFTKFFQNHYLPVRYSYDKRRPHLSSLIVSGQITRAEALVKLDEPLYNPEELEKDLDYISSKLSISRFELDEIIKLPTREHTDYPNQISLYRKLKIVQSLAEKLFRKRIQVYS